MSAQGSSRGSVPLTLQLALLGVGTFLVGTNGFVIVGLLPAIAEGLGTTPAGVTISITVYAGVVAVLAPTVATFLAGVDRILLVSIGMLLVGTGAALTAIATDLPLFIVGRAFAGLGGAAIVPTVVAAGSAMVPAARRGRAIAIVMLGFTLSTALGSPLGTAVAEWGGWRLPLAGIAVLGVLSAVVVRVFVRNVPIAPRLSLRRRASVLGEPRILLALLSTVFTIAGFNLVYILSSEFTGDATGGSGSLLALLLLLYGVGGILGNQLGGRLGDRWGTRVVASLMMAIHLVALAVMPYLAPWFVPLAVVFVIWGLAAFGTGIPVQGRLVTVDPERAAVAISWYSTAVYIGIALAPVFGQLALGVVGPRELPHAAAICVVIAAVLFQLGYVVGGRRK